ncbi:MAG: hypothetical protein ACPK85_17245 [Methanosarcina sp.]
MEQENQADIVRIKALETQVRDLEDRINELGPQVKKKAEKREYPERPTLEDLEHIFDNLKKYTDWIETGWKNGNLRDGLTFDLLNEHIETIYMFQNLIIEYKEEKQKAAWGKTQE